MATLNLYMATLNYQWQPPSSGTPDAYNIYLGPSVGQEALLATVPGTQTAYSQPRAAGSFVAYVTAVTGGLETGPSNEVQGVVLPPIPVPTLTATPSLPGNIPSIILTGS